MWVWVFFFKKNILALLPWFRDLKVSANEVCNCLALWANYTTYEIMQSYSSLGSRVKALPLICNAAYEIRPPRPLFLLFMKRAAMLHCTLITGVQSNWLQVVHLEQDTTYFSLRIWNYPNNSKWRDCAPVFRFMGELLWKAQQDHNHRQFTTTASMWTLFQQQGCLASI